MSTAATAAAAKIRHGCCMTQSEFMGIFGEDSEISVVSVSNGGCELYIPSLIDSKWQEDEVWRHHLCSEILEDPVRSCVEVAKFGFDNIVTREEFCGYVVDLVERLRGNKHGYEVEIVWELASIAVEVLRVGVGANTVFVILGRVWKEVDGDGGFGGYINMCMIGTESDVDAFYEDVVSGSLISSDQSSTDKRVIGILYAISGCAHFEDAITDP